MHDSRSATRERPVASGVGWTEVFLAPDLAGGARNVLVLAGDARRVDEQVVDVAPAVRLDRLVVAADRRAKAAPGQLHRGRAVAEPLAQASAVL